MSGANYTLSAILGVVRWEEEREQQQQKYPPYHHPEYHAIGINYFPMAVTKVKCWESYLTKGWPINCSAFVLESQTRFDLSVLIPIYPYPKLYSLKPGTVQKPRENVISPIRCSRNQWSTFKTFDWWSQSRHRGPQIPSPWHQQHQAHTSVYSTCVFCFLSS